MERLQEIANAWKETKILFTAIELDIFSALAVDGAAGYQRVAELAGLDAGNTELFLNALVSMGLIDKKNGLFRITELAETYLVKGSELYIGEYLIFRDRFTNIDNISDYMKSGPNADISRENKGLEVFDFARLAELSVAEQRAGRAEAVVNSIGRLFQHRNLNKMLDLGGGSGVIAMAMIEKNPRLDCTIFEAPDVAVIVKKNIEMYGAGNRPRVLSGNYLNDDIGSGYDVILAVASIQFAKGHFDSIFPKIHQALNDDGLFISICGETMEEKTQPRNLIIGWLGSHLKGLSVLPEKGSIRNEVCKYGFEYLDAAAAYGVHMPMDVFQKKQ